MVCRICADSNICGLESWQQNGWCTSEYDWYRPAADIPAKLLIALSENLHFWAANRMSSFSLHVASTALEGSSSLGSRTRWRPDTDKKTKKTSKNDHTDWPSTYVGIPLNNWTMGRLHSHAPCWWWNKTELKVKQNSPRSMQFYEQFHTSLRIIHILLCVDATGCTTCLQFIHSNQKSNLI